MHTMLGQRSSAGGAHCAQRQQCQRHRCRVSSTRLRAKDKGKEEDTDLVTRLVGKVFGQQALDDRNPFGLKRMDWDKVRSSCAAAQVLWQRRLAGAGPGAALGAWCGMHALPPKRQPHSTRCHHQGHPHSAHYCSVLAFCCFNTCTCQSPAGVHGQRCGPHPPGPPTDDLPHVLVVTHVHTHSMLLHKART